MAKAQTEIRSLARSHTESALKVLAGIMNEPKAPASARVAAATALLDRGWGRPDQHMTIDDKRDAFDWTRAELVAILGNARNGGGRASEANGRGRESDQVH